MPGVDCQQHVGSPCMLASATALSLLDTSPLTTCRATYTASYPHAQLRMMEAELNALASSNQQLRSQLELSSQHVSAAGRDKLAAQDAAAEATGRLQQKLTMALQEIDMLRSAGEIEGAVRKEMEATADEVSTDIGMAGLSFQNASGEGQDDGLCV